MSEDEEGNLVSLSEEKIQRYMAFKFSGSSDSASLSVKSPKVEKRLTIDTEPKPNAEALLSTSEVVESNSMPEAIDGASMQIVSLGSSGYFATPLQSLQLKVGETYSYSITARLGTYDEFLLKEDTFVNG